MISLLAAHATWVGLCLDIVGALLLWRYGLPPDVRRGGVGALLIEQVDPEEAAKAERYDCFGACRAGLLIGGFALQLVGTVAQQLR